MYRGINYLSNFCSKSLIVGTPENRHINVVLTCTHDLCFEQKRKEKCHNFYLNTGINYSPNVCSKL